MSQGNHPPCEPIDEPDAQSGLTFEIATNYEQVETAWSLVYRAYLRAGLIRPNKHKLHTVSQTIQKNTAVIFGSIGGMTVSTLSAYTDCETGLPLDTVYEDELKQMRDEGRRLAEFGLFADRREHLFRSIEALLELIRHATYFGLACNATDGVIGVHPHHANFYTRLLGFDQVGPVKTYATVKDNPVVLLRIDWAKATAQQKLPRGLRYLANNTIEPEYFDARYDLAGPGLAGTAIEQYLTQQSEGAHSVSAA